jgi:hypothetical protein
MYRMTFDLVVVKVIVDLVVAGVVQVVAEGIPTRQMGERAHPVPGTVIHWCWRTPPEG